MLNKTNAKGVLHFWFPEILLQNPLVSVTLTNCSWQGTVNPPQASLKKRWKGDALISPQTGVINFSTHLKTNRLTPCKYKTSIPTNHMLWTFILALFHHNFQVYGSSSTPYRRLHTAMDDVTFAGWSRGTQIPVAWGCMPLMAYPALKREDMNRAEYWWLYNLFTRELDVKVSRNSCRETTIHLKKKI